MKKDSRVYFYFSGHGSPDTKTGGAYILPWDGTPEFIETSAYPLEQVYTSLGNLKAQSVLVALDSCFSGAGGRSVLSKGARPLVPVKEMGEVPDNMIVLSAASGGEITSGLEEQGHGMFTYYFLRGFKGASRKQDGTLTARELYEYLKPRVQDEARRQNRNQTPRLQGEGTDFELLKNR